MRLVSNWLSVFGLATALGGCHAMITGDEGKGGGLGQPGQSGQPGQGGPAGVGGPGSTLTSEDCLGGPRAAEAPLRRLSREQYANTVRALLPDSGEVTSGFEPDERIGGFESNAVIPVSPTAVARYRDAAETLAATALSHLANVVPCDPAGAGETPCAKSFIGTFGRRVYRRPLETGEVDRLLALYSARRAKSDFAGAIGLVVQAMLQSPNFLYRVELAPGAEPGSVVPLQGGELATRLAYFFWQAGPDDALLDAAAAGMLDTPAGMAQEAERLFADERARAGVRSFVRQWLGFDKLLTLDKNMQRFPDFTDQVRRSMFEEGLRVGEEAFRGSDRSIGALFGGNFSYVDAPLAQFYGLAAAPAAGSGRVEFTDGKRGGLLTLGALLAVTSHPSDASPILRGKLIRENFLCEPLQPPPAGVKVTLPARDPKASTKEWLKSHSSNPSCQGCHQLMDPIGFAFQHYDAVGRYTDMDGTLPVDATGEIVSSGDAAGHYDGVAALGQGLAKSSQVRACLAEQLVRYAVGRPKAEQDQCSIQQAASELEGSGRDLKALLFGIVKSDAFRFRKVAL